MSISSLLPSRRSKYIVFDDKDINGQKHAERAIKRTLSLNTAIIAWSVILIPVVASTLVWFGWDLFSNLVHPIGNRENHLGFLWHVIREKDSSLWLQYVHLIQTKNLIPYLTSFLTVALGVGCWAGFIVYRFFYVHNLVAELFVSGSRASYDVQQSVKYLKKEFQDEREAIPVAPRVSIPVSTFSTHMGAFGTTGVGKTQILWNIITGILSKRDDFKLCLFDFKADFIQEYIHRPDFGLIAVYDERSLWWDFMKDINSKLDIEALAYQLVPNGNDKDPFWRNTARNLLIDAIDYMKQANLKGWETLYKLLSKRELILAAIEKSGGSSAQAIAKENNTSNSIMTTLNEAIRPIGTLARAWGDHGNGRQSISVAKWVANDPSIPKHLIFGWDENYAQTLAPIFAAFMDGVLGNKLKPESDKNIKIFMAWDEFASIPAKVSKLAAALRTGRSVGISFFLGCLNINDIYLRYGQSEGKTILSLLRTQFGLLMGGGDGAESAKYISNSWGEQIVKVASWRRMPVQYLNENGEQKVRHEWEITWTTTERKAVNPSVFTDELKSARQAGCVEGYAKFENLMPCKLKWKFYTPQNANPAVVLSPSLMDEFSNITLIENILNVANNSKVQEEPEFEEFPDDTVDIPDDVEPDDMP